ncbi:MAG: hypothetical protein ACREJB_19335, partial [Planctomycetaceae bacterium]
FKGFSIRLNPLDGVYYCDIRPTMQQDEFLQRHIQTIDHFFCSDLWTLVEREGMVEGKDVVVETEKKSRKQ